MKRQQRLEMLKHVVFITTHVKADALYDMTADYEKMEYVEGGFEFILRIPCGPITMKLHTLNGTLYGYWDGEMVKAEYPDTAAARNLWARLQYGFLPEMPCFAGN